jgi:adenosine deaminase
MRGYAIGVLLLFFQCCLSAENRLLESDYFKKLPKAELHIHLGGAYPLDYLLSIATEEQGNELKTTLNLIKERVAYHDVFTCFNIIAHIVNSTDKVQHGVEALYTSLQEDGVIYAEIRTGLKNLQSPNNSSLFTGYEEYLKAVLTGIQNKSSDQFQAKLLLSLQRSSSLEMARTTVDLAIKYQHLGVVGIDISGDSSLGQIGTIFSELMRAKANGLSLALHIGESPDESEQLYLLETLRPERIGHGVHLSPDARDWILKQKIPLEVCLTSSVLVEMISDFREHPGIAYFSQGHPIVLCTDDPLLFSTTLSQELMLAHQSGGLSLEDIEKITEGSFNHALKAVPDASSIESTFYSNPGSTMANLIIPPPELHHCVGIICNGEIELSQTLKDRFGKCLYRIGVDGGLNHCYKLEVNPDWIVGDFDSVEPEILQYYQTSTEAKSLPRAKDCTDLEAAIEKAISVSGDSQVVVWGGLGGRIDHTLSNIFLLFRHPAQLFLESENQVLFAVCETNGEVKISHASCRSLILFPLNGAAKDISLNGQKIPLIDKNKPHITPFDQIDTLSIGSGQLLVILDERSLSPEDTLPYLDLPMNFSLSQPLTHILESIREQSLNFKTMQLYSDRERIFNIQPASGTMTFTSKRGQTISLIPFHGAATGIKTQGLKWELGEETLDRLDHNFVGISNVSMGESYTVSVGEGELLCIVNEDLIDEEMADTEIPH